MRHNQPANMVTEEDLERIIADIEREAEEAKAKNGDEKEPQLAVTSESSINTSQLEAVTNAKYR